MRRAPWLLAPGLLALLLVWQTVRLSLADTSSAAVVDLGWPPVAALEADAGRRVAAGTTDGTARAEAIRALRRTPLSSAALAVIAAADLQAGDGVAADRVLAAGLIPGHRDALLNLLRLQRSATAGRVDDMARDADIALRSHPAARTAIWPALIEEAENPAFAAALARRLAANPRWRLRFVQALATDPAHVDAAFLVLSALRRTSAPPTVEEVQDYAATGVGRMPIARLHRRWLAIDPGARARAADAAIYDGGFDGLGGAAPFNWRLASDGAVVAREEGRLAVRSGTDAPLVVLSQLLRLPPGPRRIDLGAATLDGAPTTRFAVSLLCISGALAGKEELSAVPRPRRFSVAVAVPAGCDGQWLQVTALGAPGEAPPSFWIDDLAAR